MSLLGNVFLYDISYVGAWWFMQTYVLLTLSSKGLCKLIDRYHWLIIGVFISVIYVISYYFRMISPITINIKILQLMINAFVLYGNSLFSYVIGMLFRKYEIVSLIRSLIKRNNNIIGIFIIVFCLVFHAIIKTMAIAPLVAIIFIVGYVLLDIKGLFEKVLIFFGNHSTNIWLVHMQFYMIFFKDVVFCTNTVLGCFIILMALCILSSYIINVIMRKMNKLINV